MSVARIPHPLTRYPSWQRVFDLVFAALLLLPALLLGLLVAVAVLLDSPGPVLYRSRRIGRDGVPFWMLKFRTMKHLAGGPLISTKTDQRFTPVGRFLALTRLDELPQLWNVLRGDMTVVGPRPERPYFAEKFAAEHPLYGNRSRMPAGMTGLAQVSGRNELPWEERFELDLFYAGHISLWLDLRILARTVWQVIAGRGISQPGQATAQEFRGAEGR